MLQCMLRVSNKLLILTQRCVNAPFHCHDYFDVMVYYSLIFRYMARLSHKPGEA